MVEVWRRCDESARSLRLALAPIILAARRSECSSESLGNLDQLHDTGCRDSAESIRDDEYQERCENMHSEPSVGQGRHRKPRRRNARCRGRMVGRSTSRPGRPTGG